MATPVATGGIADGPKSLTEAVTLEHGPILGSLCPAVKRTAAISCAMLRRGSTAWLDGRSCHGCSDTRGDADAFYETVKGLRQQFISGHLPVGSDGQVRSVCGRFGVVAAAGELATEWGILPWEIGEATDAAAICFRAWLTERGGIGAGEDQAAIRQVRAFFEQHGVSRFPEIRDELRTINRCGWRRRDGAGWEFLVLPEAWKSEVCRGIDGEVAAKALADRRLLKREGKNLTCKVTIPEHGRPRVYVVSGALLEGDAD